MKSNGNVKVKVKTSIAQKKENFTGALFIAPYLIGYVIFQGLPFLIAVVLGFTNVRYISKLEDASFVGINNFIRMFTDVDTRTHRPLFPDVCAVNHGMRLFHRVYGKQGNPLQEPGPFHVLSSLRIQHGGSSRRIQAAARS